MKLQSVHKHMRGQSIMVHGVVYQVDKDGFIEGVSKEHAIRLCTSKECVYVEDDNGNDEVSAKTLQAEVAKEHQKAVEREQKPSMLMNRQQLLDIAATYGINGNDLTKRQILELIEEQRSE